MRSLDGKAALPRRAAGGPVLSAAGVLPFGFVPFGRRAPAEPVTRGRTGDSRIR
jgi:hypothetical protein